MPEGTIVETPTGKQGRVIPAPASADPDGPRVWVRVAACITNGVSRHAPRPIWLRCAYHPRDLREVPHA